MERNEVIAEIKKDIANTLEWGKETAEELREIGKKLDLKRLAREKIYDLPTCHRPLKECENALMKHFEENNEEYYFNMSYSMGVENAKWIDDFICGEYNDVYNQIRELQEYLKVLDETYSYTQNLVTITNQLEELEAELAEYNEEN
jgi:hypothetical protein